MLAGKVLTPEEIADHWKVTTQAILDLIASGYLKATKFAGEFRVRESDLEDYIARVNSSSPTASQLNVNSLSRVPDFPHTWPATNNPKGKTEHYTDAHEGLVTYGGRNYRVKLGFTKRFSAGRERRRSLVLVNRYAAVEFVSADTSGTGLMASIIKDTSGKQVPIGAPLPAEYSNIRVGPYQQVVIGPGASNGLAVICDADDLQAMVRHAVIRYTYKKEQR